MWVVGIDENGLGPRLGPLVATAVAIEVDAYDARRLRRAGKRLGLGDSKQNSAFGRMAAAESLALAVVERLTGAVPSDVDALLTALSLDAKDVLRAGCPDGATHDQCWAASIALPAFGGGVADGRAQLAKLEKRGVHVRFARSALACVGTLNREVARARSRVQVDLWLMERLLLAARAAHTADVDAICGMVGGIRHYGDAFVELAQRGVEEIARTRRSIAFRAPGVGTFAFEIDADDGHLPVGLASMIGKYVREIAMERQNRFYLSHDAELPRASGYHDPVTKRFVESTQPLRRRLAIAEACFERATLTAAE